MTAVQLRPTRSKGEAMLQLNKIYLGDCLDFMRQMPDKCVDLVLTDQPYGNPHGFKTKAGRFGGLFDKYKKIERTGGGWAKKYEKNIKYWDTAPDEVFFKEIFRISKNQIVWGGNYFALPPTRCFYIWEKLTISNSFTMAQAEYAWASFNQNAKIFKYAPQDSNRFHPTQKPLSLFKWCLKQSGLKNGLVFDPFSGSGTTAIACREMGLDFICIEKDPDYYALSVKRLEDYSKQGNLFEQSKQQILNQLEFKQYGKSSES